MQLPTSLGSNPAGPGNFLLDDGRWLLNGVGQLLSGVTGNDM